MKIIFNPKCLEYRQPDHPESPERISSTFKLLESLGYGFFKDITPCKEEDILLVHTKELLIKVKEGSFFDADTPNIPDIFDYAKLSVASAIKAMELAVSGETAFSLMRPPGHHATKENLGGFCYFNNIAISVKKSLTTVKKAAILDIDVHHGNGTQDVFLNHSNVLFVSMHQIPLYPGTGRKSKENCLNFPLLPQTDETKYIITLKDALKKIDEFRPKLLAVSCGFDTFEEDQIASIKLKIESYYKIAKMIKELQIPLFCVLEGGYSKKLPECVSSFIKGLI